jgi:hypothetical protein
LVKQYHPDRGGTEEEFLYLQKSYAEAKRENALGCWVTSDFIFIRPETSGVVYDFNSVTDFHYGRVYAGERNLVYELEGDTMAEDLKNIFTDFTFKDDTMREKFEWQVPSHGVTVHNILDGKTLVKQYAVIDKKREPMSYLLSDVMKLEMPLQTSIWLFNRLYALGCYMNMIGVYCLDIAPHNIVVNLKDHSIGLLGGWWYHAKAGERMRRLPVSTYHLFSNKMRETKTATIEIVTEQIKQVMRQVLAGRDIPPVYRNWLSLPAQEDILAEYTQWEHEVMPKIFPVREFYIWEPKI